MNEPIGVIVSASAIEGVKAILSPSTNVEDLEIGSLVVVKSDSGRDFLVMIDDILYDVRDASIYREADNAVVEKGIIDFLKNEMLESYIRGIIIAYREGHEIRRKGRIPQLGSKIYPIDKKDINLYYGAEDWSKLYPIGKPKVVGELKTMVPISIPDVLNLNFGIFGKAGTGKTYLANLLISYGILYNHSSTDKRISFLIFDMQGEYSFDLLDDRGNIMGPGVGKAFREEFSIYVTDEDYLSQYNYVRGIRIPLYGLSREEFEYVIDPLNPPQGFKSNLTTIQKIISSVLLYYKEEFDKVGISIDESSWILGLLLSEYTLDKLIKRIKHDKSFIESTGSIEKIKSLLIKVQEKITDEMRDKGGQPLLASYEAGSRRVSVFIDLPVSFIKTYSDRLDEIVEKVYGKGEHVIICFGGRWSRTLSIYMALANLIAYRLKSRIDESIGKTMEKGRKLLIFLEEAHRFLGREISQFNPFGKLAREYRKFGVSIVPIDQKPSELDPDVTSMLWTRMIFNMNDPRDIDSALIGLEDEGRYKKIIPLLDRGEALIYGIGIKMPVILKLVSYVDILPQLISRYKNLKNNALTTKDLY